MSSLLHNPIIVFFSITTIATVLLSPAAVSQQPYVGLTTTDCENQHNSSSGLGYFCNGAETTCRSFLTFRSTPQYDTVASVSALLGSDPSELSALNSVPLSSSFALNTLVLVPVNCSCSGGFYQSNTTYVAVQHDIYLSIANTTFQAQTTCQAIGNQAGNPPARSISVGQSITIPLRCACPTRSQNELGFEYLLSYLFAKDESVSSVSERFGVGVDYILEANSLSQGETTFDFTNILVPLENPPTVNQTLSSPPPPPPPLSPSSSPPSPGSSEKNKTWLYALLGAIGGVGLVLVLGTIVYFRVKKKKKDKNTKRSSEANELVLGSESFEAVEKAVAKREKEEYSEEFLGRLSDIAQSIKVYSFEELETATSGFSPSCLIKGSVFRGVINGDLAAIKKVDGDISKEINLLQKINHSNVIRLSGVGFNEGFWYFVYEYASNGPLSDWIHNDGKSLNWTQRIQIALDIATGLNYLHSFANPSHVHKDIKSGNILLDSDFRAKIANFGLARSTSTAQGEGQDGHFSVTKHIVGTVGYMAPEYLEHGFVSTKLDVYAFGVLLLEMLTGKEVSVLAKEHKSLSEAFGGEGEEEALRGFVDSSSMGEKYPVELVGFVVKIVDNCLKKNPEARPSMGEIVQLLSITLSNSLTWELSKGS